MYPQITRIFMIPAVATPVGLEWARGRTEAFTRIADHIVEVTHVSNESGAFQFVIDPKKVNLHLIRQSRPTARGSSRKLEPPYNADERRFIELADEVTAKTVEELRNVPSADGWAMLSGANVLFMGGSIPQFLGLEAGKGIRKILSKSGIPEPESLDYENHIDDRLGAGLMTALRVYLGKEKLGPSRTDLIPHRHHRVDWKDLSGSETRESHTLLVGSFGIDPR